MDPNALMAFVGKAVSDVGSALAASMVVIGDRLGLYRELAAAGPLTSAELAQRVVAQMALRYGDEKSLMT